MSPTMKIGEESLISRLVSAEEFVRRTTIERVRGGTIVFTNGVFDVMHRGHLEYLRDAAALGTTFVVGLNSDASVRKIKGPQRPLIGEQDRAAALLALRWVDFVVMFDEETPARLIEVIKPDVLVKGGDYQADEIVGADFVRRHGGKVVAIPYRDGYSTSSLIERIVERYADSCSKT